jgi:hypothetical protein
METEVLVGVDAAPVLEDLVECPRQDLWPAASGELDEVALRVARVERVSVSRSRSELSGPSIAREVVAPPVDRSVQLQELAGRRMERVVPDEQRSEPFGEAVAIARKEDR